MRRGGPSIPTANKRSFFVPNVWVGPKTSHQTLSSFRRCPGIGLPGPLMTRNGRNHAFPRFRAAATMPFQGSGRPNPCLSKVQGGRVHAFPRFRAAETMPFQGSRRPKPCFSKVQGRPKPSKVQGRPKPCLSKVQGGENHAFPKVQGRNWPSGPPDYTQWLASRAYRFFGQREGVRRSPPQINLCFSYLTCGLALSFSSNPLFFQKMSGDILCVYIYIYCQNGQNPSQEMAKTLVE